MTTGDTATVSTPPLLAIEALDSRTTAPRIFGLECGPARARWRILLGCLPGASATQVPVLQDGRIVCRLEVESDRADHIEVTLEWDADRGIVATSHRRVFVLPPHVRHAPVPPIHPRAGPALDLYFVIDGTTRSAPPLAPPPPQATPRSDEVQIPPPPPAPPPPPDLLLENRLEWTRHVDQLVSLANRLTQQYGDLQYGVLAFGDHQIEGIEAADLKPAYALMPERAPRLLHSLKNDALRKSLLEMKPSRGGDFVDALGDALNAAAGIGWRPDARKVLVVSGDSPGFALLQHPSVPLYGDSQTRRFDVMEQAEELHRNGVEIMTVYHSVTGGTFTVPDARPFEFAHDQYRRLASHADLAFQAATFDPEQAASTLGNWNRLIGRGSSPGVFLEATSDPE